MASCSAFSFSVTPLSIMLKVPRIAWVCAYGFTSLDRPSSTSLTVSIGSASVMTPWLFSMLLWKACLM